MHLCTYAFHEDRKCFVVFEIFKFFRKLLMHFYKWIYTRLTRKSLVTLVWLNAHFYIGLFSIISSFGIWTSPNICHFSIILT